MEKFIIMSEWEKSIELLTNEQRGIFLTALFDFHSDRPINIEDTSVAILWNALLPHIERINASYRASVENGKKGGRPRKTKPKPNDNLNKPKVILTETLKEKEKEKDKVKEKVNADYTWSKNDYIAAWEKNLRTFCMGDEITSDNLDELFIDTIVI